MKNKFGFTLAEVLITLGIIGIVASITIPILQNNIEETQFKTAYKKAYADLSNAFNSVSSSNEFVANAGLYSNVKINFLLVQNKFKVVKTCDNALAEGCWLDSCMSKNECFSSLASENSQGKSFGFIDSSGRQWIHYKPSTAFFLVVDTNGEKLPNQMGKDRFPFRLDDNTGGYNGIPYKVVISPDYIGATPSTCYSGGCYNTSWLYK